MATDRGWMYNSRPNAGGTLQPNFMAGVTEFIASALSKPSVVSIDTDGNQCIPCPCERCDNLYNKDLETVELHLYQHGFTTLYDVWYKHGEPHPNSANNQALSPTNDAVHRMGDMVRDAAGQQFNWNEEEPAGVAKKFFEMMEASKKPLWKFNSTGEMKCEAHTVLSAVTHAIAVKSKHQLSQKCFNDVLQLMKSTLPPGEEMPQNWYQARRLVDGLGMEAQKIDVCPNFCMLYYSEVNKNKTRCDVCGESRYNPPGPNKKAKPIPKKQVRYLPITPRLQRMYMTASSAKNMRWHKEGVRHKAPVMVHPADAEAWKYFAEKHPTFADEIRNVWLGITTDGFMPFNSNAAPYSCWPVFVFPYNLPPGMIMKEESMFLALLIPGPKHPGRDIDVCLEPLIDELKRLWLDGAMTWDGYKKENFEMHTQLLWTVSDYPAYEMLCGWGTHGRLGCFYCMDKTKAFQLQYGGKATWFDATRCMLPPNHPFRRDRKNFIKGKVENDSPPPRLSGEQLLDIVSLIPDIKWGKGGKLKQIPGYGVTHHWQKKSIFWSLPYWKDNLLQHNLDMMHLEKNFTENVLYTLLSIGGKTKDNEKARKDLALYCDRPTQHLIPVDNSGKMKKPKAPFALSPEDKMIVLTWLKDVVRFPDGYASNWSRLVNLTTSTFTGLKSHDLHVFMERLLPIAFRDFVPDAVWDVLCEISAFFREICAKEIDPNRLATLEADFVVTMCKAEKIFPPGFFNSMEHLALHVAHEARMGGPVASRWMFPCERRNKEQRMRVTNKARVEGSIVEATIAKEIGTFAKDYFVEKQNIDQGVQTSNRSAGKLSIFDTPNRLIGSKRRMTLSETDFRAAHDYVILNCPEICEKYMGEFDTCMLNNGVATSPLDLPRIRQEGFATWLRKKVINSRDEGDYYIRMVGIMPSKEPYFYEGCEVNGYRFHTQKYGQTMSSKSSGVCIKGEWDANNTQIDYYGILQEIIELQYDAHTVLLFRCDWFDIINGVNVDRKHGIVEVKHTSRLRNYEPFVLAAQATQVCYLPYPSQKAERRQWWVAMKTSPKSRFRSERDDTNIEFYQEERPDNPIEPTIGEDIDWDGMLIREDEFELVTDTMNLPSTSTSNEPPSSTRDENNMEEGENEDDMDQYDEEDDLQSDDPDEEY